MKTCSMCRETKPLSEFTKRSAARSGYYSRCKTCSRAASKAHYDSNRETYLLRAKVRKEQQAKVLLQVYEAAKDRPCSRCGKKFPLVAMDLHHVEGDKKYNVSTMVSAGHSLETLRQEIAKCIVLCACCHRIVHREMNVPVAQLD